jgi:sulfur carrier protein ThiS
LFATLRKYFPDYDPDQGMNVEMNEGSTVNDIIHALYLSENEAKVIIVNGISKKLTDLIHNGDEVNIFTPISGG